MPKAVARKSGGKSIGLAMMTMLKAADMPNLETNTQSITSHYSVSVKSSPTAKAAPKAKENTRLRFIPNLTAITPANVYARHSERAEKMLLMKITPSMYFM